MPVHYNANNLTLHLPDIQWISEREPKIRIFWKIGVAGYEVTALP